MNLPQQLQEYLKYPILQLINVNTSLPEDEKKFDALSQSVLVTFLAGLYKITRSKESAALVNKESNGGQLLSVIFNDEEEMNTIANYSYQPISIVKLKVAEVANGYLAFMQQLPVEETQKEDYLQNLMSDQRHEILRYVPVGLKLGELLNDGSLEDNTNKMEGPISSLMHKIENAFSKSD